jgi:DNA repair photolyase
MSIYESPLTLAASPIFGAKIVASLEKSEVAKERRRGRGALTNSSGRFEPLQRVNDETTFTQDEPLPAFKTTVTLEHPRKIITYNQSPDIPFDRSINAYRGCEHGCAYCFARPTHAYMGLSPGLDFETKLFVKLDAPALLEKELSSPNYTVKPIAMGTNTDPYQPIEKTYQTTRQLLLLLEKTQHPVTIVTKSALILRDSDILARMAQNNLVRVALSITTLDAKLARALEPRAATPTLRLETIRQLSALAIPTAVMVAPIIPALNDSEIENILAASYAAGAREAAYVLLRMPHEIKELFREWLVAHRPDAARRVLTLLKDMRGGMDYDSRYGTRQTGQGPYAQSLTARFVLAKKRLGFSASRQKLNCTSFMPPFALNKPQQLSLFT